MQQQVVLVGIVGERFDFGGGVEGAELGGVGDRNHTRLCAVNAADVEHRSLDDFWGELAVWGWQVPKLEAGHLLWRTTLISIDVCRLGANHGLPTLGASLQRHDVCAGAVEHRKRQRLRAKLGLNHCVESSGDRVVAIGNLVTLVHRQHRGHYIGMHAGIVIAGESAPDFAFL